MLSIQYCSDLHLEFKENEKFIRQKPIEKAGNILILAGDILLFQESFEKHWFWDFASDTYEQVFWLPGNHEYYAGADIAEQGFFVNEKIRTNVLLVNNQAVDYKGVDLIFSTLWSYIPMAQATITERSVNDFNLISYHGKRLTSEKFNKLHQQSLDFIATAISQSETEKRIVITHHVPSLSLINPVHFTSKINGAFVTPLEKQIEEWSPDYWIFGHSHYNCPETTVGKTKMRTNQLGYVQSNEHSGYKSNACILI
ncbi:MAG: metallophosphoesterase [Bacteroidota bacterium]